MKVLGISPLDKDATASLVEDGRVLFAAAEERFSRTKQHAGFPSRAIACALETTGIRAEEIDVVAYAFLPWEVEVDHIRRCFAQERELLHQAGRGSLSGLLAAADARVPDRTQAIHGLGSANERMQKGWAKELFYRLSGVSPLISKRFALAGSREWSERAQVDHRKWHNELETELGKLGLLPKLKRYEHHLSHAANSYYASGFERALIVTLDGYGSGLAGSISLGEGGKISRLHNLEFPYSLGTFYETVTSSLGYHPDRHAGKIVGLAAYGDPQVLSDVLLERFRLEDGDLRILENMNIYFSRHLASRYPKIDVAAAYQHVLEVAACSVVEHWVREAGCDAIVLSGGVTANVKMNQRIHEIAGVQRIFIYPNMGDGGCGTGLALMISRNEQVDRGSETIQDAYHGPSYGPEEIREELKRAGLAFSEPENLPAEVAKRIHSGQVIGRFDGRMEYGPRALGNRSILYHAREPEVNQWLNQRLGRTEFMPFAPVTLWEARERCYLNLSGAEHTSLFMTITFDCTEWMKKECPAAVHVDGTARPQLIKRENNPGYYDILQEYEKLSGIPCLINTSFNMHEEPIVCTPHDAVRAFLDGKLDGLAIGPYFVPHPARLKEEGSAAAQGSRGGGSLVSSS